MTTRTYSDYCFHCPVGSIRLLGIADVYTSSDGSEWRSGAGGIGFYMAALDHVEVSGTTIRYVLSPPPEGLIYAQTDYDASEHSAQGTFGPAGPLVLEAQAGSATAVLRGNALIISNDITAAGAPRFEYYSAMVGSVVPFEITYTIIGETWTPLTFDHLFDYSGVGWVDFAHPISAPRPVELAISGPSTVPAESATTFGAVVRYENGLLRNVSTLAGWTAEPAAVATVAEGVLTTGTLLVPEQGLTLRATYVEGADSLAAEKSVRCLAGASAEDPGAWPMFQGNPRHTGYVPISLDPAAFKVRWTRTLGAGPYYYLNPVAAGEGKVFVTPTYSWPALYALRASDGEMLWSKGFGSVTVNPPSFGYGMVYVQTVNFENDTWLRAYDADSGEPVFQSRHSAQYERYFAPTLKDGRVYADGGTYGGMYSFDAYSGEQLWYARLPQYDKWTPAVDGGRAYAYVGQYPAGLYAQDASTGTPVSFVADPDYDWFDYDMNLAPVIGAHEDVLVIYNGRLMSFDSSLGAIRWQIRSHFSGQPCVARDRIYAIDGGKLVVLDEQTHATLWSWQAPAGVLTGPMIVTDTHVLASTAGRVHAVDLATHTGVWSYPAGGTLALADRTLYVASSSGNGTLTALDAPTYVPAMYLRQTGGSLVLNATAPTAKTPLFKDSPGLAFGGGNPWREIGTWKASAPLFTGSVVGLNAVHVFVGLKNGDDEGTRFDVRADVYMNDVLLLTSGQALCATGVTRNPDLAREVIVSLPAFEARTFGPTDRVSIRVSTRIGTNGTGGSCGGHGGAVGLRLYFDAASRPSRFNAGP